MDFKLGFISIAFVIRRSLPAVANQACLAQQAGDVVIRRIRNPYSPLNATLQKNCLTPEAAKQSINEWTINKSVLFLNFFIFI